MKHSGLNSSQVLSPCPATIERASSPQKERSCCFIVSFALQVVRPPTELSVDLDLPDAEA